MDPAEFAKAFVQVITACGALAAGVIAAMNGKRSKERDSNVEALMKMVGGIDGKLDGLTSRFDRHEAAITERVASLRSDMDDVKGRLRTLEEKGRKR